MQSLKQQKQDNQVREAVQNIALAAQESAENTQEILSSVEETTDVMEKISKAWKMQGSVSEKLNELVKKFKI